MHQLVNFNRPFKGRPDEEMRVKRAASQIVESCTAMGIRAHDVSNGGNLKIVHEGLLDYAWFLEVSCGYIRELMEETIQ